MKCEDIQSELVDYMDGEMSESRRTRISAHLDDCDACREQCRRLEQADSSVRQALSSLAPPGKYLTGARRKALKEAHTASQRSIKLMTFRRFVAAAAIAAIIASAWVMYPDLTSFFGPARETIPADRVATSPYEMSPLMVTSPGEGNELRVLPARVHGSRKSVPQQGRASLASGLNHAGSVRMHPEWVIVPAENAYYDDSEAAYWW